MEEQVWSDLVRVSEQLVAADGQPPAVPWFYPDPAKLIFHELSESVPRQELEPEPLQLDTLQVRWTSALAALRFGVVAVLLMSLLMLSGTHQ